MIAIIDYGAGNLQSVKYALDRIGVKSIITDDKHVIQGVDQIIFPGQGHFGACMRALQDKELLEVICEAACEKPFLGICLGMQILFESSQEAEGIPGLGLMKGKVTRFNKGQKLPQVGWNQVCSPGCELLNGKYYYFTHSYYCDTGDAECILAKSNYGEPFVCAVKKGRLMAVQFHPEKSGRDGMQLLEGFVRGKIC